VAMLRSGAQKLLLKYCNGPV